MWLISFSRGARSVGGVHDVSSATIRWVAALSLAIVVGLSFVVTHHNWLTDADTTVVRWIADRRTPLITDAARVLTYLGNLWVLAGVTIGFAVTPRLTRSTVAASWLPAFALALAAIIDPLFKQAVGRPRPPHELAVMLQQATGYPSGHSAQSAATWIALAIVAAVGARHPRRWLAAGFAITGIVGASRVVLGVHSPTDVIGGWALGLTIALILFEIAGGLRRRRERPIAE